MKIPMGTRLRFLAILVILFMGGCGGGGSSSGGVAPVISALSYSPTAVYVNDGGGEITVYGTFDFTDPEGDLATVILRVIDASEQTVVSQEIPITGAEGMTAGTLQGIITVGTTVAGDFTIDIYVIDKHGLSSNHLGGAFRISDFPWAAKSAMPTPRLQFATATVGGLIYVIGGRDASSTNTPKPPMATVEIYNPVSDSWSVAPSMPEALAATAAAVVNGKIYVVGGIPELGVSSTAVLEYNPAAGEWSTMPNTMPYDRYSAAAAAYDGLIYLPGGSAAGVRDTDTMLVYNPSTDEWNSGSQMSQSRTESATAAIGGNILVYGGYCLDTGYLSSVESYATTLDTWVSRSDGSPRTNMGVAVINDVMYAFGGSYTNVALDRVSAYDSTTGAWTDKTPMPQAIDYARAETVNGKVYVFGTNDTLEYAPDNDIK